MNEKWIWFDMDGTLADLYGVEGWLADLNAYNARPYEQAKPLLNLQVLARVLHKAQARGYKIGIVSWLSKYSNAEYDKAVAKAKREWLASHLASVKFDAVDIIAYGIEKQVGRSGILFDDEKPNRERWGVGAYDVDNIIAIIKAV